MLIVPLFALLVSAPFAVFAMYAAWDHNPQGAIHELKVDRISDVHWGYWLAIGARDG